MIYLKPKKSHNVITTLLAKVEPIDIYIYKQIICNRDKPITEILKEKKT